MIILAPSLVAIAGALASFPLRARLRWVAPLSLGVLALAFAGVAALDSSATDELAGLTVRMSALARLFDLTLIGLLLAVTAYVAFAEPMHNYFPVALFTAAAVHAVLVVDAALPLLLLLVGSLAVPAVAFTFRVHENRSVEAAVRHFGSVAVGGTLGIAALALAAQRPTPAGEEELAVRLLLVLLIVAFALLLGVLPFHGHLAFLSSESPAPALAVLFGVQVPITFLALPLLLAQSGVLPAVAAVEKAQVVLLALGLISSLGGGLLAIGAPDLRRLVTYSVISNTGTCLVGLATFSGPGIAGAVGTALITGIAAGHQFVTAGALWRAMHPEDVAPSARRAPVAAIAFAVGSLAMVGMPPLAGFPARFLVAQMAFALSVPVGGAVLLATALLLMAHQRAAFRLFSDPIESWRIERRPVAGLIGFALMAALFAGGLYPDAYLNPIADFSREFLQALRPF
jgi:multicomponent Na+:H+ antiporter subunit D